MNLIKATAKEIFAQPTVWVYLLLITGGVASGGWLAGAVKGMGKEEPLSATIVAIPSDLASLVIIVAAAMMAAGAFSRGNIGYAYLADNNRGLELATRITLVVAALVGAGAIGMALGWGGLTVAGAELTWETAEDSRYFVAAIVQWLTLATLSATTAVILRNGVWAIVMWMADFFVVEGALALAGAKWSEFLLQFFPVTAARVVGFGEYAGLDLSPALATVILAAWVVALGLGAYTIVRRRPVL